MPDECDTNITERRDGEEEEEEEEKKSRLLSITSHSLHSSTNDHRRLETQPIKRLGSLSAMMH